MHTRLVVFARSERVTSKKRAIWPVALVLAAAFLLPSQSVQALAIRLSDGASIVTVNDGGAGDLNPVTGAVTFLGPIGGWGINVTTGLSYPILGAPTLPYLDLNSVNVSSSGAGSLTIYLTDTNFNSGSGPRTFLSEIGGTLTSSPGSSLDFDAFLDMGNNAFGVSGSGVTQLADLGFTGSPLADAAGGNAVVGPGNYSVTLRVTMNPGGPGVTSFDASTRIPEPGTLALLGLGLLGLGLARRHPTAA